MSDYGFYADDDTIRQALANFRNGIETAPNIQSLLGSEANFAKALYKYSVQHTDQPDFVRDVESDDDANRKLNHGNYLAYGLAASVLWVLGIPHAFALMHGKTRRGALVFDIADLIKDSIVLPWSFIAAQEGYDDQDFRDLCLQKFTQHKAMEFMFNQVKSQSLMWRKDEPLSN